MKRLHYILVSLLLLIPAALVTYRVTSLGYPLPPTGTARVWQLSIDGRLGTTLQGEAMVSIGLPHSSPALMVLEETITSGGLDYSLLHEGMNRFGLWSGEHAGEVEALSYRATILVRPNIAAEEPRPFPGPYPEGVSEEEKSLANTLTGRWKDVTPAARLRLIAATERGEWGTPAPSLEDLRAWAEVQGKRGRLEALVVLFLSAGLPARAAEGLRLEQGAVQKTLTRIEVWNGKGWDAVEPDTGSVRREAWSFLPLTRGGVPAVRVGKGALNSIQWGLNSQVMNQWRLQFERVRQSDRFLDRWSLFRLPPDFQETFRILLLVPIGTLVISLLRNVVGLPTFGTFMPVLMALAFRNTGLFYGLAIFAGVISIGYGVRHAIDRLHLLLVPRLSLILTFVIGCFTLLALIGTRYGLREVMAVGLLPFVILTMTVERFFVVTEESGLPRALVTAGGSAAVATVTYAILHVETLQLSFFLYPELLFAVVALQVLMGRYTGYRLLELRRFDRFRRPL